MKAHPPWPILAVSAFSVWFAGAALGQANAPGTQAGPPSAGEPRTPPAAQAIPPGTQLPKGEMVLPESTVIPGAGGVVTKGGGGMVAEQPVPSGKAAEGPGTNDYPTVARADYVFACMQVNGQTRDVLEKCSCSIDVIASLLPFSEYEEAETILSVKQRGGKSLGIFEYGPAKEKVKTMKRAQIEGELRCF